MLGVALQQIEEPFRYGKGHIGLESFQEAFVRDIRQVMKQSGGRYKIENLDNLWRMASEIIGDPCFGLKASALWHPSYFGAFAYAMLARNTLRATLERLDRYHRVISDEKFTKLDETEEGLRLTLLFSHEKRDIPERNDAALALILSMCRMNYVEDLAPVSVTFTHPMPSCSARFFEYFRSPVLFDAPADSLTLPIEAVDKHLPGSHPQLAELHDQIMIQYLARLDQEHITQQVKATIVDQLPSGNVTDESVSRIMNKSSRKLQRQLESAGTTFNTLLNEIRQDLAKKFKRAADLHDRDCVFARLFGIQCFFKGVQTVDGSYSE